MHELLAHTPYDHVERKSLLNARQQLEDLSRQMHDEVSETENLRKNLAVERMIVEGCDILLDVNQVFVRQGEFSIQAPIESLLLEIYRLDFVNICSVNTHFHRICEYGKSLTLAKCTSYHPVNTRRL